MVYPGGCRVTRARARSTERGIGSRPRVLHPRRWASIWRRSPCPPRTEPTSTRPAPRPRTRARSKWPRRRACPRSHHSSGAPCTRSSPIWMTASSASTRCNWDPAGERQSTGSSPTYDAGPTVTEAPAGARAWDACWSAPPRPGRPAANATGPRSLISRHCTCSVLNRVCPSLVAGARAPELAHPDPGSAPGHGSGRARRLWTPARPSAPAGSDQRRRGGWGPGSGGKLAADVRGRA
jgi:hypothetical protein